MENLNNYVVSNRASQNQQIDREVRHSFAEQAFVWFVLGLVGAVLMRLNLGPLALGSYLLLLCAGPVSLLFSVFASVYSIVELILNCFGTDLLNILTTKF